MCCVVAVLLAGCATDSNRDGAQTPDWESQAVGAGPVIAPPPVEPIVPIRPPAPAPVAVSPAPPALASHPGEIWVPLGRWCKANGLTAPSLISQAPVPAYALSTPGGNLVVRIGSLVVHCDGMDVRLGFAPQMMNGQPCVHALDVRKTLEPLVKGAGPSLIRTNPTIVIDAGHGGEDSGTSSVLGAQCEKDFTLDWARRLGSLLATNGWQVYLTRNSDVEIAISNRVVFAEAHKADVFLSLHFNSSAPNDQQAGLETYCLTPTGLPSTVTRGYSDDAALVFPNNAFDVQNLRLALQVHRALLQVNGRLDRGVRRARYLGVLRGQNRAAILIEGGYLSNPREARRIADPAYRQKLAEAVATGLGKPEGRSPKPDSEARNPRPDLRAQRPEVPSTNVARP